MDVYCSNKKLFKVYKKGKSTKKYRFPQNIIDKFIMRVDALKAAETVHDLWNNPAFKFEKLQGYDNRYSIRLNRQYRLEIEIEWTNEEKTKGKIDLIDITNHYE